MRASTRRPHARQDPKHCDRPSGEAPGVVAGAYGQGRPCAAGRTGQHSASRFPLPGLGEPPRPVLRKDKVRHVGQPVALVVAETLAQAEATRRREEWCRSTTMRCPQSMLRDRRRRHFPQYRVRLGTTPAISPHEAAFARAARVTTPRAREQPRGGELDGAAQRRSAPGTSASGRPVLYTPRQGPHFVRDPWPSRCSRCRRRRCASSRRRTSAAASA